MIDLVVLNILLIFQTSNVKKYEFLFLDWNISNSSLGKGSTEAIISLTRLSDIWIHTLFISTLIHSFLQLLLFRGRCLQSDSRCSPAELLCLLLQIKGNLKIQVNRKFLLSKKVTAHEKRWHFRQNYETTTENQHHS